MGFPDKFNNNADGRDPDFGAIFISNTATKRECFKRGLLALPSSEIRFVEQVKTGMILFLFEYEKKQLHGVFRASCDGAMNIVPNAFNSSGKQFPAQVKFTQIWHCKPLSETLFRDAIRENYFSAHKFNFGLSEKQVHKLLYLFSKRKLELEVMRPTMSSRYSKSPSDKIRADGDDSLSMSDRSMTEDLRKNGQRIVFSADSPGLHHSNADPSDIYSDPFLDPSDLVQNQIRPSSATIHPTQEQMLEKSYATYGDWSSRSTLLYDPDAPGLNFSHPSSVRINNRSRSMEGNASPSNNCRWNSLSNQPGPMRTELEDMNRDIPIGYGYTNRSPYGSDRDCMPFSTARNSGQFAAESFYEAGNSIPSLKCSSAPVPLPDISGRVHEPFSSFFHNHKSTLARNSHQLAAESGAYEAGNSIPSSSPVYPLVISGRKHAYSPSVFHNHESHAARNFDHLASESVTYEADNRIPYLQSSSAPVPPPDISGREHESFSSAFCNYKSCAARNFDHLGSESVTCQADNSIPSLSSLFYDYKPCVGNDAYDMTLQKNNETFTLGENQGYDMTFQKNNETFNPGVPSAIESYSQFQYCDPLIHGHDIECCENPKIKNSGYQKQKRSVFSRLSSMQDVSKKELEKNAQSEAYGFNASVDEVMKMAHQCHKQWLAKRKLKPLVQHNNAESLKDRTKIVSSRMKSDCFENTMKNGSMDLTPACEGNSDETAEEIPFVDFKRRSKLRKLNDDNEIRSSNQRQKSENLVLVSQKKRKLIRPNFGKRTTSDDKGINLVTSQNLEVPLSHESFDLKNVSESCCSVVQTEDNIKTDVEVQNIIRQKHSEGNNRSLAREYVCSEGGGKSRDGAVAFNDGSECLEKINDQNAVSLASCKDETYHIKNLESLFSICQERYAGNVIGGRSINTEVAMSNDGDSSFTNKDGSDCLQNSGNEKAPIDTCHTKENALKSVCKDTASLHSISQEL
ncbi:hypothetical protein RIF29_35630 [Crotalaria pallida]|uniref:DCD domain-containing protein n=1 Tax=Crotalaria pallida TaxID=3830 RepID=A0AAN9EAH9_CROPI